MAKKEAFIWDSSHNMRSIKEVLVNDYGLNLTGWILSGSTYYLIDLSNAWLTSEWP